MAEYTVTFIQYHTYTVDADNENEALSNAEKEFNADMRSAIAHTYYDDYEIEGGNEEEDEDCGND
jgi:hypothetical protein